MFGPTRKWSRPVSAKLFTCLLVSSQTPTGALMSTSVPFTPLFSSLYPQTVHFTNNPLGRHKLSDTYLIYPHAVSHSRSKRKNMSWLTATHLCDLWLTYRNKIHKYQNTFSPSLFVYLCHSHWINCIVIDIHTYTYGLSSGRGLKTKIRGTGKVMIKQLCLLSHVFFWDWGH